MLDLTAFQRDALIVLHGLETATGVEIQSELDAYYDEEISGGRLYPSLNELVDRQFIRKATEDGRTNRYSLTETGARLLNDHIDWRDRHLDGI